MLKKSLISIAIILMLLVGFSVSSYAQNFYPNIYISGGLTFGFAMDASGMVADSEWINWGDTSSYTGYDMWFSDWYGGLGFYSYGLLLAITGEVVVKDGDPDSGAGEWSGSYVMYAGAPFTDDLYTRGNTLDTFYFIGVSAYFRDVLGSGGTFYFYNGRQYLANVAHWSPISLTASRDYILASHVIGLSFDLGMMTLDLNIGRQAAPNGADYNSDGVDEVEVDYYFLDIELEKLSLGPATINFGIRYVQANTSLGSGYYYDLARDYSTFDVAEMRFLLDFSLDLDIISLQLTGAYRLGIAGDSANNEGASDFNMQFTFGLYMAPLTVYVAYGMMGSNWTNPILGFGAPRGSESSTIDANGFQIKTMSLETWIEFDLGIGYVDLMYHLGLGVSTYPLYYLFGTALTEAVFLDSTGAIDSTATTQVLELHFNMYLFEGKDAVFTFVFGFNNMSADILLFLYGSGSYSNMYFGIGFSTYLS